MEMHCSNKPQRFMEGEGLGRLRDWMRSSTGRRTSKWKNKNCTLLRVQTILMQNTSLSVFLHETFVKKNLCVSFWALLIPRRVESEIKNYWNNFSVFLHLLCRKLGVHTKVAWYFDIVLCASFHINIAKFVFLFAKFIYSKKCMHNFRDFFGCLAVSRWVSWSSRWLNLMWLVVHF